jgi:LysR family nitrogen assimilation transcriptional regulator
MNLRQLQYFSKVLETRSMTAAADQLHLAQPALGSQIKLLEDELGVALFNRHSRGVTPTPAGDLLYQHAQDILGRVDRAMDEVRHLGSVERPQLRLGISPSMVRMIGPEAIIALQRKVASGVAFSIIEERTHTLLEALGQGLVDIAFVNNVEKTPGLERKAVLEEDLLLVTTPETAPAVADDTVSFVEALAQPLAISGRRGVLRQIVENEAERLSMRVNVAYELYSIASMKALVLRGDAATVAPYNIVAEEIKSGALVGKRITRPALTRTIFVVRRSVIPDNAFGIDAFIEAMIDAYLAQVQPWVRRL